MWYENYVIFRNSGFDSELQGIRLFWSSEIIFSPFYCAPIETGILNDWCCILYHFASKTAASHSYKNRRRSEKATRDLRKFSCQRTTHAVLQQDLAIDLPRCCLNYQLSTYGRRTVAGEKRRWRLNYSLWSLQNFSRPALDCSNFFTVFVQLERWYSTPRKAMNAWVCKEKALQTFPENQDSLWVAASNASTLMPAFNHKFGTVTWIEPLIIDQSLNRATPLWYLAKTYLRSTGVKRRSSSFTRVLF